MVAAKRSIPKKAVPARQPGPRNTAPKRPGLDKQANDAYDKYGKNKNLANLPSAKSTPMSIINSYAKRTQVKTVTADKVNRPGLNKGAGFGNINLQDPKFTSSRAKLPGSLVSKQYNPTSGSSDRRGGNLFDPAGSTNAAREYGYNKIRRVSGQRKGGK